MLILTRKKNESIIIDGNIEIQVISIEEGKVKLGINAPKEIEILRSEIVHKVQESNLEAVTTGDSMSRLAEQIKKNK
ncbi:MAG: carbon storage regulator [Clostridiales bacterium]|jgi:carbon storage regulator|nr:carbon storage regulator [Clostridiales bacterium]